MKFYTNLALIVLLLGCTAMHASTNFPSSSLLDKNKTVLLGVYCRDIKLAGAGQDCIFNLARCVGIGVGI